MTDRNAILHDMLLPVGLPACEAPMLKESDGTFITWNVDGERDSYASGTKYMHQTRYELNIWAIPVDDARQITLEVLDALHMKRYDGVLVKANLEGNRWVEEVQRRQITLSVLMIEVGG